MFKIIRLFPIPAMSSINKALLKNPIRIRTLQLILIAEINVKEVFQLRKMISAKSCELT
jgi:hypothetical protein